MYGPKLNCFTEPDYGVPGNADTIGIITNDKTIKNNPDLVKKFTQATQKGYEYAYANPDDAAQILVDEGYIAGYQLIEDGKQGVIRVTLKYGEGKSQVITGLRRVSKPGLRIYSNVEEMPKVMKGLGVAIVSTSKGIMTDREARKQNVGGEVLAFIW